ncbi:unnamed protein product [Litomosoides sigmodontis]|uniref:Uncharacterized protein n=1 Tax=Litomosoides sigmodontis TaxID=42156 RepID=A0A3P6TLY7_LITSI|nr:unnamed protein product [Litomosoides sigmodontis]
MNLLKKNEVLKELSDELPLNSLLLKATKTVDDRLQLHCNTFKKISKRMESIHLLAIIMKILFICMQISTFTGIALPLITMCCRKGLSEESSIDRNLKPKVSREVMNTPEQRNAIKKIKEGQMTAANENETVDDAVSNWGAVQKMERKV